MPYRKKYRRRRIFRRRRRSYRKTRRYSRYSNINKGIINVKLRKTVAITTNGSAEIIAPFGDDPSSCNDWTSMGTLYDLYRVRACSIKWIPTGNLSQFAGNNAGYFILPCYVFYDSDNYGFPGTVTDDNKALEYGNCKIKNLSRMWSYYKVFSKVASSASRTYGGWIDVGSPAQTQGINIYKDNIHSSLAASTFYGTVIVTYYCQFKFKR